MLRFALTRSLCARRLAPALRPLSTANDVVVVGVAEARDTTAKALRAIGWDESDAALQAEIMTAAECAGNNQGLVKMFDPKLMAPAPGAAKPVVERETATSAVVDARQAPGMLAAVTAADLCAAKALAGAVAVVAAYNTSTSSGQLAFYCARAAKRGVVCLALANSPEFVAAAAGGAPIFGTNPLAVGVPTGSGDPFVFRPASVFFNCVEARILGPFGSVSGS